MPKSYDEAQRALELARKHFPLLYPDGRHHLRPDRTLAIDYSPNVPVCDYCMYKRNRSQCKAAECTGMAALIPATVEEVKKIIAARVANILEGK